MVFTSPPWVPQLPYDPPDSMTVADFMDNGRDRPPIAHSSHCSPYVCGVTGLCYTAPEVKQQTDALARGIADALSISPNAGSAWDKAIALHSYNSIDYVPLTHAIHRLSGIAVLTSANSSVCDLESQLQLSRAMALFTCVPLIETALRAAATVGIPRSRIFLIAVGGFAVPNDSALISVQDLISRGSRLPRLEPLGWTSGQGKRQTAYLCFSSGTSGLPKAVMISHWNVISSILQLVTYESVSRKKLKLTTLTTMGLLPFSHAYALIVVAHSGTWRGDRIVVLPQFELYQFLRSIERFQIDFLPVVPTVLIRMINSPSVCNMFNLTSVKYVYSSAAPLGAETVQKLKDQYPRWDIGQGYGMTETSTVVCTTSQVDVNFGSSGSLVPLARAKIIDLDTGAEITKYDCPGELLVQSPTVSLGYLSNDDANEETFVSSHDGRWVRTGDKALFRTAPSGHEHMFVVGRIKELIKVKGYQVAPAELEALILTHKAISDCAVVGVPHEEAGEVPMAYVVRSVGCDEITSETIVSEILQLIKETKPRHKWIRGGITFVHEIPRNSRGKILRQQLGRDV